MPDLGSSGAKLDRRLAGGPLADLENALGTQPADAAAVLVALPRLSAAQKRIVADQDLARLKSALPRQALAEAIRALGFDPAAEAWRRRIFGGLGADAPSLLEDLRLEPGLRLTWLVAEQAPAATVLALMGKVPVDRRQELLESSPFMADLARRPDGTPLVAALLEGLLLWTGDGVGPDQDYLPQDTSEAPDKFAEWIRSKDPAKRPAITDMTMMNCWEGVMFAANLAGKLPFACLVTIYEETQAAGKGTEDQVYQAKSQGDLRREQLEQMVGTRFPNHPAEARERIIEAVLKSSRGEMPLHRPERLAGSMAYLAQLEDAIGVNQAVRWHANQGKPIPIGNLVFFDRTAHVAISLGANERGETMIMSLWESDGGDHFEKTTVEALRDRKYKEQAPEITHGPAHW